MSQVKRKGIQKGIYILPNLLTTGNLFCGFFSIIRAINGDYLTAAWVILLAGVFDCLDGRVARLTRGQSEFGLEYDSLVDLGSFGLAPAILIYTWTLFHFERVGWAAAFLFFACGALRLARFNVQVSDVEKKSFQGLPIPAAAYTLASFVILYHSIYGGGRPQSYLVLFTTFVLALLMVSNIAYRSFKILDLERRASFFLLVLFVGILFVIALAPQIMIFVVTVGYVLLGLVEELFRYPKRVVRFLRFLKQSFGIIPREVKREEKYNREEVSLKVVGYDQDIK